MLKVNIIGHDYKYELFQILNLFYDKNEFEFTNDESEIQSIFIENTAKFKFDDLVVEDEIEVLDAKNIKNALKRTALMALSRKLNKNIPWGILVGIRPTKIVHENLKIGKKYEDVKKLLTEYYLLSNEKAELTIEVAKNEAKLLSKPERAVSLYVGIPFCPTRCIYCSFASNAVYGNENLLEMYVEALIKEIDSILLYLTTNNIKIDTIYFGGGTPSSLNLKQMDKVLNKISSYVNLSEIREFTYEAGRPDSIDEDKLKLLKKYKVSRISINPQSMNQCTLEKIGRRHTVEDVKEKFKLARELGFNNINMDIIIGLPDEDLNSIKITMEEIKKLSPESVTIHTMAVKRASVLNEMEYKNKTENIVEMYEYAVSVCKEMNMIPYYMYRQKNMVSPLENVGYSKKDYECIYNIQMIAENISIVSLGADAITKIVFEEENRIERYPNVKDVREYINRIDEMISKKIEAISQLYHC